MGVEAYEVIAHDWLSVEFAINDLATRVVGQEVHPTSSPTFANGTITTDLTVGGDLTLAGGLILSGLADGGVCYINGSLEIDTDVTNFAWDYTNNRLGIGTSSPDSVLHIKANFPGIVGNDYAGQIIIQNPANDVTSNVVITAYESDGSGNPDQQLWYLGSSSTSNSDIIFLNRRNAKLQLGTNDSYYLTILGNGYVGIGVTDPDTKLEVLHQGNQLKLSYDGTDNCVFAVNTSGRLTVTPSGGSMVFNSALLVNVDEYVLGIFGSNYGFESRVAKDTNYTSHLRLESGRGNLATPTTSQNNDELGSIHFSCYPGIGDEFLPIAKISGLVDGTIGGTGDIPGRLEFYTVPDGSSTLTKRLVIDNAGNFDFQSGNLTTTGTLGCNILTMTSNSDTIELSHDGSNASIKWSDGVLNLVQTEENVAAIVSIRSAGTSAGDDAELRLYDEDAAEYMRFWCSGGYANFDIIGTAPQAMRINTSAGSDVWFFSGAADGETPLFRIYGRRTGDSQRNVKLAVSDAVDDMFAISNVDYYGIGGKLKVNALTLPNAELDVVGSGIISTALRIGDGTAPTHILELIDNTDFDSNQVASIIGNTRATAQDNDEAYISYYLDNDAGISIETMKFIWELQHVANGSEDGAFRIELPYDGNLVEVMDIDMGAVPNAIVNFNDAQIDMDFLISSADGDNPYQFWFEGETGYLWLGSSNSAPDPASKLHVIGNVTVERVTATGGSVDVKVLEGQNAEFRLFDAVGQRGELQWFGSGGNNYVRFRSIGEGVDIRFGANSSPDQLVLISTPGSADHVGFSNTSPLATIDVIGDARFGNSTDNYTSFATNGSQTMVGTATVWNDLQFQISDAKVTPASLLPSWEAFTTNTSEYAFSVNDEVDTSANEIPHSWKQGTVGHAHIHITTKAVPAQEQKARFTITFAYADTDEVWVEAPLTAELTIPISTTALTNFYLDLGDITLTNYLIEAQMRCRVKRIAKSAGGTEYVGDIFITQVGIHFEDDTIGSGTERSK